MLRIYDDDDDDDDDAYLFALTYFFCNFLLTRTDGYPLSLDVFVFCLLLWFSVKNCFITLLQVRRRDIFTTIYSKPVDGVAQW